MKKFTLLIFLTVFAFGFGQTSATSLGENNPVVFQQSSTSMNYISEITPEMEMEIQANEAIAIQRPANTNRASAVNTGMNSTLMVNIIPTAGAAETFTPDVGDLFFDPGGPGGGPDGTPGNYPNCGCLTETTLAGVTELEFLDYEVFGTFDWLKVYDGADNTGVLLFDNSAGGNGANTFAQLLAANGGSGVFTGTSGDFFFEFFATAVVNRLGWEVEILATGGGGGGACTPDSITTAFTAGNNFAGNMFDITASGTDDVEIEKFDINIGSGTANISVYSRPGSYVGFEGSSAGWTLMGTEVVTGLGENVPTELNVGGLVIPQGETYGIYVTVSDHPSVSMYYTNGNNVYSDANVTIETGVGKGAPDFTGGTFASRSWNGTVYYCSGATGGGGGDCETPELEINQDITDTCMAFINQTDIAQSFVPLTDISVGAGVRFEAASTGESLTLSIWDNLPNASGNEIATGTVTTDGDLWVDVFWDPVSVNPGDTYYLVIEGTVSTCLSGSINNPYPNGNVFANPGYQSFPGFDYTFRTYTCDTVVGPTNNWECADATALSCGDVSTGTTAGATNSGGNASPDVFYSYTGSGDAELVTISLCDGGTTYDSFLRVFESCGDLSLGSEIALNDDFCGLQSQLTFESDGVSTYIIMVEGFGTASGDYSLAITCELAPVLECGGQFVDTGGPNGNYSNNEDETWTVTPDNVDDFVTVIFTEFDVEANWDALYVFDGPDTSSPLISSGNPPTTSGFPAGGYYGTTIPGPFASTHSTGALTFRFLSDGSVTRPGWVADIVCAPVPPPNDLIENAISVTAEDQPYTDPEVRLQYATNELLNPDGCAIAGTNGVWYSFTAEVDGTAEASVTTPAGATAVIFYEAPSEAVGDETDLTYNYEWSNQCAPGTEAIITTTAGQSYYIFVLNTGGPSDVVIDISDSLLSTNDNTIDGFTFYPNPTMDILNLRSNISIDSIELFNMLGQKVISQAIGATTSQVDVSELATGTYLMKVSAEGQTATYQVIKK